MYPRDGIRNLPIFAKVKALSVNPVLPSLKRLIRLCLDKLHTRFVRWTRPLTPSLLLGTIADLGRNKSELMAENALLRQQLVILKRQVKRPARTKRDRILLVLLARAVRAWKQTLFIVQPETLLRWHSELFRLYWKRRSKASSHKPKVAAETVALIREMARENRLWGAERIRGELLKLGIRVGKRTIQKHMRQVRTPLLSTAVCVLHHRTQIKEGGPRRSDSISDRSLGCSTTPRSYPIWACPEVSDS